MKGARKYRAQGGDPLASTKDDSEKVCFWKYIAIESWEKCEETSTLSFRSNMRKPLNDTACWNAEHEELKPVTDEICPEGRREQDSRAENSAKGAVAHLRSSPNAEQKDMWKTMRQKSTGTDDQDQCLIPGQRPQRWNRWGCGSDRYPTSQGNTWKDSHHLHRCKLHSNNADFLALFQSYTFPTEYIPFQILYILNIN